MDNGKHYDVLCAASLNSEISLRVDNGSIPFSRWHDKKLTADSIWREGGSFRIQTEGEEVEFPPEELEESVAGSSVNIGIGLSRLGFRTAIFGAVGQDVDGNTIREQLGNYQGIDLFDFSRGETGTPTTVVAVEPDGKSTLFCYKPPYRLNADDVINHILYREEKRVTADYLVVSGTRQPELELIWRLFLHDDLFSDAVKVFMPNPELFDLDPPEAHQFGDIMEKTDLFQLNEDEARSLTGLSNPEKAAEKIFEMGPRVVIVTLNVQGSVAFGFNGDNGEIQSLSEDALKSTVEDDTGAGDAFLAGVIYAHQKGFDLRTQLRAGAWVAAQNIQCIGGHAGMPNKKQLEEFLEKDS